MLLFLVCCCPASMARELGKLAVGCRSDVYFYREYQRERVD
jgi:hypothetical protein